MQKRGVIAVAATFAALAFAAPYASAFEPAGKVECLAASDPGGGWDFTCRSVGSVLEDLELVPRNVQTINMAGAGGGVGFAHVVSKRAGDDQLLIAASTATTSRLAQDQFPGMNAEMVNWIGALGADYGVIAVRADSELDTLSELMDSLKEDPRSVKFSGGSPKGGWDHLKLLIAAQAAGIEDLPRIPYLSYNNGGEAMTQVVGGHVDAFSGDISEARGFMASGDLRVLAVLSEERLPGDLSHIPTAIEQGIEAVAPNWRGFYMPGELSDEAKQYWVDAMGTVYHSEEWQSVMQNNGLMPFHMAGPEFETFVMQQIGDIRQLSQDIGLIQ
ncbi:Bug family tripartite tricarboxylate transporter substrate binding protein [Halomonas cupida]|uniref:Bug family tripartite tricarboxylate transporter substrate binding protein n=1 Tax=Halomonas cupida TaxID=44933 RepID=UPI003A912372